MDVFWKTSMSFSAPSNGAGLFLALPKKRRKRLGTGDGGLDNIVLSRLPCASRAKRAGANSAIHGLEHARLAPAWRCDARHRPRRRFFAPLTAIHGLRP